MKIEQVKFSEIKVLQEISKTTFFDTYSDGNTEADMRKYLDEKFSLDTLISEFKNLNSSFYFVYFDDKLAAYFKLNTENAQSETKLNNALEIERIYVLIEFKGKGIGKAIIDFVKDLAISKSLSHLWLGVWTKNTLAIKFYEKNGFKVFDTHTFILGTDHQEDYIMKIDF